MLKTLNKYIGGGALDGKSPPRFDRHGRFGMIFVLSLIAHVVFFAVVIKLDQWSFRRMVARSRSRGTQLKLVKIAELATTKDRLPAVRRPPEPIERAELSKLKLDSSHADDTHLIARSPTPSPRGMPAPSRPGRTPEEQQAKNGARDSKSGLRPPAARLLQIKGPPESGAQEAAQASVPQTMSPPPPAPSRPASGVDDMAPSGRQEPAQSKKGRQEGSGPSELGLSVIQSQYAAYVRAKIWKVNERIMPRGWIEATLTQKVSADFEIVLTRGGRIASARLVRSCGYPTLDESARQAINTASPFERWPQEVGDTITLTVTVYYTPYR